MKTCVKEGAFPKTDCTRKFKKPPWPALEAKLVGVYQSIHALALDAQIFVVGYPRFFTTRPTSKAHCAVKSTDEPRINNVIHQGDIHIARAVRTAKSISVGSQLHYVDMFKAFTKHDLCRGAAAELRSPPYQNGLVSAGNVESFHPNKRGHKRFTRLIDRAAR